MIGFVWDIFESTTEAIGDAAEYRVSYLLGRGKHEQAKLAAYKSMFMTSILSLIVTGVFLGLGYFLPEWLTEDETIQAMMTELLPLIALGNVTMNVGMVCWALVGAQGRYFLATSIATACSFLITIPLGAIFTVWLNIDLQGLTFAVVLGYTVTAMLLSTLLLVSDWEKISKKIQDKMGAAEAKVLDVEADDDGDDFTLSSDAGSSESESSRGTKHVDGFTLISTVTNDIADPSQMVSSYQTELELAKNQTLEAEDSYRSYTNLVSQILLEVSELDSAAIKAEADVAELESKAKIFSSGWIAGRTSGSFVGSRKKKAQKELDAAREVANQNRQKVRDALDRLGTAESAAEIARVESVRLRKKYEEMYYHRQSGQVSWEKPAFDDAELKGTTVHPHQPDDTSEMSSDERNGSGYRDYQVRWDPMKPLSFRLSPASKQAKPSEPDQEIEPEKKSTEMLLV